MTRSTLRGIVLVFSVCAYSACAVSSGAPRVTLTAAEPAWFSGAVRPGASGVDAPVRGHVVPAIYPPSAGSSLASGDVWLDLRVEADGTVSRTRIVTSSPPFDAPAEDAVKQWRFHPARRGRTPVAAIVRLKISFVGGAHESESDTEPEWFNGAARPATNGVEPPRATKVVHPAQSNWCDSAVARPSGDVWLDLRVEANGKVSQQRIVQALSIPGHATKAHDAARQWEFVPAFQQGRPIPAIVRMKLTFAGNGCDVDF